MMYKFSMFVLSIALCLSAVAAYYSILGLMAIFSMAAIPIVIMGCILEIAKVTVTIWLHQYWHRAKFFMKTYLTLAVISLAVLTSMGIFGFLSKAHLDQIVPAADISAQVQIFDDRIKSERDNIEASRVALRQMDTQVDARLGRSSDEKGAERAIQIRRSQSKERQQLQNDIAVAQKNIVLFQQQRSPVASEARKVEADVGPIKYIAALLYGDDPDPNLLEKAVRLVIILIVTVFDPLALMMVLAGVSSLGWSKESKANGNLTKIPNNIVNIEPLENIAQQQKTNSTDNSWQEPTDSRSYENIDDPLDQLIPDSTVDSIVLDVSDDGPGYYRCLDNGLADTVEQLPQTKTATNIKLASIHDNLMNGGIADEDLERITFHNMTKDGYVSSSVTDGEGNLSTKNHKKEALLAMYPNLKIKADNIQLNLNKIEFGTEFSLMPIKGDMFLRVDIFPTRLFKFNGHKWIELDKNISNGYLFDEQYIKHLIDKISKGEYDPELLNSNEQQQIEEYLNKSNLLAKDDTGN